MLATPTFLRFGHAHLSKMADHTEQETNEQEQCSSTAPDAESQPNSSPLLSRRALDELGQLQEVAEPPDPENYPLHSPWAFWFER